MPFYPLNLQVLGRRCVVVGGGEVAERKVGSLLECGATVKVVSPEMTPQIDHWAEEGRIEVVQRGFQEEDVAGAVIVIAATDNPAVNQSVATASRARSILVNVVDTPALCDFYVPASLSRGDLMLTISTNGQSPMLAKKLRIALEQQFGPEYGPFLDMLGRLRRHLQAHVPDQGHRTAIEAEFLSSRALALIAEGRSSEAEALLDTCISQLPQSAQ